MTEIAKSLVSREISSLIAGIGLLLLCVICHREGSSMREGKEGAYRAICHVLAIFFLGLGVMFLTVWLF